MTVPQMVTMELYSLEELHDHPGIDWDAGPGRPRRCGTWPTGPGIVPRSFAAVSPSSVTGTAPRCGPGGTTPAASGRSTSSVCPTDPRPPSSRRRSASTPPCAHQNVIAVATEAGDHRPGRLPGGDRRRGRRHRCGATGHSGQPPGCPVEPGAHWMHGISDEQLVDAPRWPTCCPNCCRSPPAGPAPQRVQPAGRWLWGAFEQVGVALADLIPADDWGQIDTSALPVKHPPASADRTPGPARTACTPGVRWVIRVVQSMSAASAPDPTHDSPQGSRAGPTIKDRIPVPAAVLTADAEGR